MYVMHSHTKNIPSQINNNILTIIEKAAIALLAGKYARISRRNGSLSLRSENEA